MIYGVVSGFVDLFHVQFQPSCLLVTLCLVAESCPNSLRPHELFSRQEHWSGLPFPSLVFFPPSISMRGLLNSFKPSTAVVPQWGCQCFMKSSSACSQAGLGVRLTATVLQAPSLLRGWKGTHAGVRQVFCPLSLGHFLPRL